MELAFVLVAAALVAFANGQNDVAKGVATLVGGGVTDYRRALLWGTLWTALGAVAAVFVAGAMVSTFGKGLLAPGHLPTADGAIAALLAAGTWVAVATRTSLPVSTTHALVGGVAGAGLAVYGAGGVAWSTIGHKMALPLLLSPLVAAAIAGVLYAAAFRRARATPTCVCVGRETVPRAHGSGAGLAIAVTRTTVMAGSLQACATHPAGARATIDHLHWLTAGAASFARGLNDAPKIAALGLAATVLTGHQLSWGLWFGVVTAAMIAGSLLAGRRIAQLLAERVSAMDHERGFVSNLVTAGLVGAGAMYGLPLSTTHVSSGTIIGVGVASGRPGAVAWRTVGHLAMAWVVTVPVAAAMAALYVGLLSMV